MNFNYRAAVGGFLALGFVGCASAPSQNPAIDQMLIREVGSIDSSLAAQIMTEPVPYRSKNRKKIEGTIQNKIKWWIRYYTVRDRDLFQRNLARGENYRPLVQQILRQHHLPVELFYLALIESGYVTHAKSEASAVGIWQFMRPTALHYGLGIDEVLDERRHPIAATHAAARYLDDLHRKFNSWYLAIAAYNAGQGRVGAAIRKGRTRDFWELAERGLLPQETMDYIPKFLAAATIAEHMDLFGFEELKTNPSAYRWPTVSQVSIKPGTKISVIARQANLSEKELLRLNPKLRQILSKRGKKAIQIWVPMQSAASFAFVETKLVTKKKI